MLIPTMKRPTAHKKIILLSKLHFIASVMAFWGTKTLKLSLMEKSSNITEVTRTDCRNFPYHNKQLPSRYYGIIYYSTA
jgi:hypothetical protein